MRTTSPDEELRRISQRGALAASGEELAAFAATKSGAMEVVSRGKELSNNAADQTPLLRQATSHGKSETDEVATSAVVAEDEEGASCMQDTVLTPAGSSITSPPHLPQFLSPEDPAGQEGSPTSGGGGPAEMENNQFAEINLLRLTSAIRENARQRVEREFLVEDLLHHAATRRNGYETKRRQGVKISAQSEDKKVQLQHEGTKPPTLLHDSENARTLLPIVALLEALHSLQALDCGLFLAILKRVRPLLVVEPSRAVGDEVESSAACFSTSSSRAAERSEEEQLASSGSSVPSKTSAGASDKNEVDVADNYEDCSSSGEAGADGEDDHRSKNLHARAARLTSSASASKRSRNDKKRKMKSIKARYVYTRNRKLERKEYLKREYEKHVLAKQKDALTSFQRFFLIGMQYVYYYPRHDDLHVADADVGKNIGTNENKNHYLHARHGNLNFYARHLGLKLKTSQDQCHEAKMTAQIEDARHVLHNLFYERCIGDEGVSTYREGRKGRGATFVSQNKELRVEAGESCEQVAMNENDNEVALLEDEVARTPNRSPDLSALAGAPVATSGQQHSVRNLIAFASRLISSQVGASSRRPLEVAVPSSTWSANTRLSAAASLSATAPLPIWITNLLLQVSRQIPQEKRFSKKNTASEDAKMRTTAARTESRDECEKLCLSLEQDPDTDAQARFIKQLTQCLFYFEVYGERSRSDSSSGSHEACSVSVSHAPSPARRDENLDHKDHDDSAAQVAQMIRKTCLPFLIELQSELLTAATVGKREFLHKPAYSYPMKDTVVMILKLIRLYNSSGSFSCNSTTCADEAEGEKVGPSDTFFSTIADEYLRSTSVFCGEQEKKKFFQPPTRGNDIEIAGSGTSSATSPTELKNLLPQQNHKTGGEESENGNTGASLLRREDHHAARFLYNYDALSQEEFNALMLGENGIEEEKKNQTAWESHEHVAFSSPSTSTRAERYSFNTPNESCNFIMSEGVPILHQIQSQETQTARAHL
ncbi:unnamed protein product [Amoebophrya sp. A120]|nr:unnamed protein product [Amoebophrya sp. A120]|eukprot:GSA120T00013406001.1